MTLLQWLRDLRLRSELWRMNHVLARCGTSMEEMGRAGYRAGTAMRGLIVAMWPLVQWGEVERMVGGDLVSFDFRRVEAL